MSRARSPPQAPGSAAPAAHGRASISRPSPAASLAAPAGQWWVDAANGRLRIALADVQWLSAADNYIELHAPPETYLERRTLADFLAHPAATGLFIRVHRGHAVNASHVKRIAPLPHGEALLTLTSGQQLRVSRSYRDQLRG